MEPGAVCQGETLGLAKARNECVLRRGQSQGMAVASQARRTMALRDVARKIVSRIADTGFYSAVGTADGIRKRSSQLADQGRTGAGEHTCATEGVERQTDQQ